MRLGRVAPQGECTVCHETFAVNEDGRLRAHRGGQGGPWYCLGGGEPPVQHVPHVHICDVCGARWDEDA